MASDTTGRLVLIVGPSGVGKGLLVRTLRARHPEWVFPPSVTTRAPRKGELDGDQYYFVSTKTFAEYIATGKLLEYATVHNREQYGTLKQPILDAITAGKIVLREVDIQGMHSIHAVLPASQRLSIFVTPPSLATLKAHILQRQSHMPAEELDRRLVSAEKELAEQTHADHTVVSEEGKIEDCAEEVEKILGKE